MFVMVPEKRGLTDTLETFSASGRQNELILPSVCSRSSLKREFFGKFLADLGANHVNLTEVVQITRFCSSSGGGGCGRQTAM